MAGFLVDDDAMSSAGGKSMLSGLHPHHPQSLQTYTKQSFLESETGNTARSASQWLQCAPNSMAAADLARRILPRGRT